MDISVRVYTYVCERISLSSLVHISVSDALPPPPLSSLSLSNYVVYTGILVGKAK